MDVSAFTVDTAAVLTVAGVALTGLGILWGIRKVIKTVNRS